MREIAERVQETAAAYSISSACCVAHCILWRPCVVEIESNINNHFYDNLGG